MIDLMIHILDTWTPLGRVSVVSTTMAPLYTLVGGGGWRGELISRQDLVISLQLQRSGGEQEVALYTEAR